MDYYSYQNMISDAMLLQKQYSGLIECETIGYSVKRRKIIMLIMGCGYRTVFLTGGIHGRESINTKLLMMLVSYYTNEADGRVIPILGLPGCVMYAKRTIFDLVLPRIMADDEVTAEELAALGEGGLCLNCDHCIYPNCGFGTGW